MKEELEVNKRGKAEESWKDTEGEVSNKTERRVADLQARVRGRVAFAKEWLGGLL